MLWLLLICILAVCIVTVDRLYFGSLYCLRRRMLVCIFDSLCCDCFSSVLCQFVSRLLIVCVLEVGSLCCDYFSHLYFDSLYCDCCLDVFWQFVLWLLLVCIFGSLCCLRRLFVCILEIYVILIGCIVYYIVTTTLLAPSNPNWWVLRCNLNLSQFKLILSRFK